MDPNFWHHRWATNDIGFHEKEANPSLVKHFNQLSLAKNDRIFIPLCGKTLDIAWLLSRDFRVAGAELSELAIKQLFEELGIKPKVSPLGKINHYSAANIDIFVGDIFDISKNILGAVDAIYDRAAIVALPKATRNRYTKHLRTISDHAQQLLLSFEYDQRLMDGPPFSVSNEEIKQHYMNHYNLTHLASIDIPGGLKGKCAAQENVWLLKKLNKKR